MTRIFQVDVTVRVKEKHLKVVMDVLEKVLKQEYGCGTILSWGMQCTLANLKKVNKR